MDSESSKSLARVLVTSAVHIISCLIRRLWHKEKINVLDLRNAAHVVCFGIDSVPGMTSQRDYAQVSLCAILTRPEVKFHVFKQQKRGEGKSKSKIIFDIHIRMPFRFDQANKKNLSYTL